MKVRIAAATNGAPMIVLDAESKYPFQFGVKKARMIMAAINNVKAFAESEGRTILPQNVSAAVASAAESVDGVPF
ncbi:MAG TPA: hypothetical protein VIY48_09745 [Candidatus Paceibacterota bacterium]